MRHIGQPEVAASEMLADLVHSDAIEEVAKNDLVADEAALQGPDVRAERMCDFPDGGAAHRHEDPDRLLDFLRDGTVAGGYHATNKLARMGGERQVRHWVAALHVRPADHDPVEIGSELE